MKAAYFMQHGGPEVLEYGDVPDPVAKPGQVVVDVHAASVNGADWKTRIGHYRKIREFPYIPGRDFSGVVAKLGEGVTDLKVGDRVFGVVEVTDEGAYAEKLAKHLGARVITTASAANHDYVKSLGADEVIDYNKGRHLRGKFVFKVR